MRCANPVTPTLYMTKILNILEPKLTSKVKSEIAQEILGSKAANSIVFCSFTLSLPLSYGSYNENRYIIKYIGLTYSVATSMV